MIHKNSCPLGYSRNDLKALLGVRLTEFDHWMNGQTMVVCSGVAYNYDTGKYEPTICAERAHGAVVYTWDVEAFLNGREPLD